jgi:hypothetical protein
MKQRTARRLVVVLIALLGMITPSSAPICSALANDIRPAHKRIPLATSAVGANLLSMEDAAANRRRTNLLVGLPISFEANHGQADVRFKFVSRGDRRTLYLMPTEALMIMTGSSVTGDRTEETATLSRTHVKEAGTPAASLRMMLVGANPAAKIAGEQEQEGKTSYLIGNDSRHWRTNLSMYGRVRCSSVYRGIDLVYHGNQQQLEYDFIVGPSANPKAIKLDFLGAERLSLDISGDLVLSTPAGEVRHRRPTIYQESKGVRKQVAGRYLIKGKNRVGFLIGSYDKSKPLIIDPEIVYSTCIGGLNGSVDTSVKADTVSDVAIDKAGNAYVTGESAALDLPTTPGAFQSVNRTVGKYYGRLSDAFVAKFDPSGKLVYSTYFGGLGYDCGLNIAIDSSGNAYVKGITNSSDLPITAGAMQPRCLGCTIYDEENRPHEGMDTFIAKLDSAGAQLVYSTYLGFFATYEGGFAVDGNGNAIVAGNIWENGLHVVNGFQTTIRSIRGIGAYPNGYVAKLNSTGSAWLYSTYLGGSFGEFLRGLAIDAEGKIYVTGVTMSHDFPTKYGFQMEARMPEREQTIFLTKIDPDKLGPESLLYSTYVGERSYCYNLTVDKDGNAYIVGGLPQNGPGSFPRTTLLQPSRRFAGPVLIKLDTKISGDQSLQFATYFASSDAEFYTYALDAAVDSSGNIYLAGYTQDPDFSEVANLQVIGPFVSSTDGQHFTSHRIATPNSLQMTGQVKFIAIDPQDPSTVYAGNSESNYLLYKSTDGGQSWGETMVGSITNIPSAVAINPKDSKVVYAGMKDSNCLVYKSTDAGGSWAKVGPPVSYYTEAKSVVIDPLDPSTVYVGCSDLVDQSPGVMKSTDAGLTWTAKNNGLAVSDVTALAMDPKTPRTLWAGTSNGIFKSTDGGDTWSDNRITKFVVSLAIDPKTPATVYAGLADVDIRISSVDGRGNPRRRLSIESPATMEGMVKSTDGGASWQTVNDGFGPFVPVGYSVAIDPQNSSTIYAATYDGFFRSTDAGAHWSLTGSVYSHTWAVALAARSDSKPTTIYAGTRITPKAFIMKLNSDGTQILFSSAFGGNVYSDFGHAIAVDDAETAFVVGQTFARNFPTSNAFQTADSVNNGSFSSGFLMKIDTREKPAPPIKPGPSVVRIVDVSVSGKRLLVHGENFSDGAIIMLEDQEVATINDAQNPTTLLSSKKGGKKIKPGSTVTLHVRNADGSMSQGFQYQRPAN